MWIEKKPLFLFYQMSCLWDIISILSIFPLNNMMFVFLANGFYNLLE